MAFKAEIPYGAYWTTPFVRWQGSFSHLHSVQFAAHVATKELAKRSIAPDVFDYGTLGITIPQQHSFYGFPWIAGLIGAKRVGGPTIMQACATSVRCLLSAAEEIELGMATTALAIACDRMSNGPHLYYPSPNGPGGTGRSEDWVMDNFNCDPLGPHAMIRTAENVAARYNLSTARQHEVVLRREEQYRDATANDAAFLKRFMTLPFDVPDSGLKKVIARLEGDEGITHSTPDALARLRPVLEGGTVTFGGQTHPTDANAAIVLSTPDRARELSRDPKIRIRVHGFGLARAELAYMPEAPVPAAGRALAAAGRTVKQMDAIKTHNPFALNDLLFAAQTDADLAKMNNFGCSLVYGHPNAPMGMRGVIELVEELTMRGGGWGLFTGCAAGDTAMAVVLQVDGA